MNLLFIGIDCLRQSYFMNFNSLSEGLIRYGLQQKIFEFIVDIFDYVQLKEIS